MKAENETANRNERIEQKIDYCKLKNIALNKSANLEQVKLTEKGRRNRLLYSLGATIMGPYLVADPKGAEDGWTPDGVLVSL